MDDHRVRCVHGFHSKHLEHQTNNWRGSRETQREVRLRVSPRPQYRRNDSELHHGQGLGFSSAATAQPGSERDERAPQWASSLLGLASSGSFWYGSDFTFVFPYYAWFVQDDFKVTSRLTLNLGLRYAVPSPGPKRKKEEPVASIRNCRIPCRRASGGRLDFTG